MAIIVNPVDFNPSALTAPDVYLQVIPPQAYIPGAPASVSAVIGTASWGPLNQANLISNTTSLISTYGTISAASVSDIHDLATDVIIALDQAGQAGLSLQCVRVSDGTDTEADVVLNVAANSSLTKVVFGGTITTSDNVTLHFAGGGLTSPVSVSYTVLSGDTTLTILAGHVAAAINGTTSLSSVFVTATNVGPILYITAAGPTAVPLVTNTSTGTPTETLTITTTNPIPGGTVNAIYSGVLGNQIVCSVLAGTNATLLNVLLTGWQGKGQEFYVGLPNTSGFWAALQAALAGGVSATQGPSQLCRFTPATQGNPGAPALGQFTLSGGTDGRAVDTANLIGNNDTVPPTGIYCTTNLLPSIQQIWIAGLTDQTAFPEMSAFGLQNGIAYGLAAPINSTITQFINILNTAGIIDYACFAPLDWVLFFDSINNVQRFVTPLPYVMGAITALSPEQSPLNLPLYNVQATPRSQAGAPYSNAEVGLANSNGIILINNPIPLGNTFGIRTGVNRAMSGTNPAQGPVEYTRMTNFLIQSFGAVLGQFEGQLQSQKPQDPLRAAVRNLCNNFLNELQGNNQIDAYNVICDFSQTGGPGLNTPVTIPQHILNVAVQVRYLSSVWFLVFTLQGGVTVQISSSVITPGATT